MKKAKIMLMVIAVLAVTGGVLAFKAKTTTKPLICTTTQATPAGLCSFDPTSSTISPLVGIPAFYTTEIVDINTDCSQLTCPYYNPKFRLDE